MNIRTRLDRLESRRPHNQLARDHAAEVRAVGLESLRFEYGAHLPEDDLILRMIASDLKLRARLMKAWQK